MRAGGGKQKGAQFEREVCVMLSRWLTSGTREDIFWRSAMSGGRATVGRKKGKQHDNQVGDITCIDLVGHHFSNCFAIECKYYAKLDFEGLITGKGKLIQFWKEINNQAVMHGKYPFLVAKQNRMRPLICLDLKGRQKLDVLQRYTTVICRPSDLHILDAEHFFATCKPFLTGA